MGSVREAAPIVVGPGAGPSIRFPTAGQGPKTLHFHGILTYNLSPNDILSDNEGKET